ncbi:MAG: hypothetical protein ACRDTV_15440, partial [Mycobacterium sp.]
MRGVGNDPGGYHEAGTDPPLTVELLADLQAGLLDDDTAAKVRRQVRADPGAAQAWAGLQRVHRAVASLGTETSPAADVDPAVVARIAAALRSAGPPRTGRRSG